MICQNTICPEPASLRVISGVPSCNRARTRAAKSGLGCAKTWALTRISGGRVKPENGPSSAKGSIALGCSQLIAPPSRRPPCRNTTGSKGSSRKAAGFAAANLGPANRTNVPPAFTQSSSGSGSAKGSISAQMIRSGLASKTCSNAPVIKATFGASAF